MRFIQLPLSTVFAVFFTLSLADMGYALIKNGFDLTSGLVDSTKIYSGGPPRDGIPALTHPSFVDHDQQTFLRDDDRILGIVMGNVAKAYPIKILNWHEVVNDRIQEEPVIITYCPLCGTGIAFSAVVDDQILEFGVSGLLYNSDMLLYDRQSESLWSQIPGQAITGKYQGRLLSRLVTNHTTWQRWREEHPNTLLLSYDTGHNRDYSRNPYSGYELARELYFPVEPKPPDSLHPKETVLGVKVGKSTKAYPFSVLEKLDTTRVHDSIAGKTVIITWDSKGRAAQAHDGSGYPLEFMQAFWFAWYAFNRDTEVFSTED